MQTQSVPYAPYTLAYWRYPLVPIACTYRLYPSLSTRYRLTLVDPALSVVDKLDELRATVSLTMPLHSNAHKKVRITNDAHSLGSLLVPQHEEHTNINNLNSEAPSQWLKLSPRLASALCVCVLSSSGSARRLSAEWKPASNWQPATVRTVRTLA